CLPCHTSATHLCSPPEQLRILCARACNLLYTVLDRRGVRMRILSAHYHQTSAFLGAYNPEFAGGALFYPTRMPLLAGEAVILDVRLPNMPNPVLVRGRVAHVDTQRVGSWISFDAEDRSTLEFLLGMARGNLEIRPVTRKSGRFPVELQVDWQVGDSDDLYISS